MYNNVEPRTREERVIFRFFKYVIGWA